MSENLTTWVVLRGIQHYQTSETVSLAVMKAFTGTDPAAVERAAEDYERELTEAGDGEWLADFAEYERADLRVFFEAHQATETEIVGEGTQ